MFRGAVAPGLLIGLIAAQFAPGARAEAQRVVLVKLDGVPADVLEQELQRTDPVTHKSTLPWIDHVFRQKGIRLANFYVRAISLSAPSWSLLDTGQHLRIHGNAEFDRYTYHVYDYLNFFPFYVGYALSRRVDMPGVEVLDDLGVPLLIDRFPYESTYQSFQLFQRGVRWKTLQDSIPRHFTSRSLHDLLDEWTIGFEIGSSVEEQTEHEMLAKLTDSKIRYLDYFTGDYDHVAHGTEDAAAQRQALQRIDSFIGRLWTAIEASPLASQTVLVVVSDHGMNTKPGIYSQGYDLVQFFNSREGGAHHVVTNRRPLTEYKLSGLDPFVSEVATPSEQSLYLRDVSSQYPTALLDLDGNERASIYFRNSDLNALQILLEEISRQSTRPEVQQALIAAFLRIVDRHRISWRATAVGLSEELGALHHAIEAERKEIGALQTKWTQAQRDQGMDKAARRRAVRLDAWRGQEREYSEYVNSLRKLLALSPADFIKRVPSASDLIPKRAMGDGNTIYDLENYVIGPASSGPVLSSGGSLDFDRSFQRINYLSQLSKLTVKNNVQASVSSHPVDFIAMRVPKAALSPSLAPEDSPGEDAIWLYGDEQHQALILSRQDTTGNLEFRYLPVRGLQQDADGKIRFEHAQLAADFPLRLWEDPQLITPSGDRSAWLDGWHSEREWFETIHRTTYSNSILALHEQFLETGCPPESAGDVQLLERFRLRRRRLAEPDFLIFANDHWNFNVRGFNPGGNHGSLRRISTHSVLMFAGGAQTGIPENLVIEKPYDSLSFVPTILELMGIQQPASPLPGKPIGELFQKAEGAGAKP